MTTKSKCGAKTQNKNRNKNQQQVTNTHAHSLPQFKPLDLVTVALQTPKKPS